VTQDTLPSTISRPELRLVHFLSHLRLYLTKGQSREGFTSVDASANTACHANSQTRVNSLGKSLYLMMPLSMEA